MSSSTSTAAPTASSDTPSPSPTESPSGGGSSPPSSTLYLLTFLATLFVLLFICSAIIMRSYLQRRRLRLQIEAQIAAGLLPPEAALARLRRHYQYDYGEKPKLWDCYITPESDPETVQKQWDELEPFALRFDTKEAANLPTSSQPHVRIVEHEPLIYNPIPDILEWFRVHLHLRKAVVSNPETASQDSHDDELPPYDDRAPVLVAVFVQMPAPHRARRPDNEDDLIPEVSIGVAQLPLCAENPKPTAV